MIYCPNCGTANREGSRFCNECGRKLPSKTGIICPMCSRVNPGGNVYCDNCHARLVPLTAGPSDAGQRAEPSAAPSSAPAAIKKGLSLPIKPADELTPGATEPAAEAGSAETPDRLVSLRATPQPMAEAQPAAPTPPPADNRPASEEAPDWMRPAEGATPDWLQRLSEPAGQPRPDVTPPGPRQAAGSASSPGSAGASTPGGGGSKDETADWLTQPQADKSEDEIPDWLRELEGKAGSAATAAAPEPAAAPEEYVRPTRAQGQPPTEATAAEPSAEEPDWLASLRSQPALEPSAQPPAAEEPDWLASFHSQPQPEPPAAEPSPEAAAETPDWLSRLSDVPEPTLAESPAERSAASVEAPDWLRDITTQPASTEVAPAGETSPAGSDVPDWLREFGADMPAPGGAATSGPMAAFMGEDIGSITQAETPAWLADVSQPTPSAPTVEEPPAQVPAWLRNLGPLPAGPVRAEEAPFGETAPAAAGQIPDWLRQAQPDQTPPAFADESGRPFAAPVGQTTGAETGLEAAAIPSWLQALRPAKAAGEPEPAAEGGIAEAEGVLAGLQSVLPAAPMMGQPHGAPAVIMAQAPASDTAHANLFQELLARGSLSTPTVKPDTGGKLRMRDRAGRWLMAALLLALVLVPNISDITKSFFQLGAIDSKVYQPAAEQIDKLATGQRVLLVFDYDAYQSGEIDAIATAFLTHLSQRGVEVVAASLNPAGSAIADRVSRSLKPAVLTDTSFVNQGYFAGQSVGAQSALLSTRPALIIVLAGSPESMRWWIEQAAASRTPAPIIAGLSAGVLPQTQPYLQSGQVKAAVTGMSAGLAYQRFLDGASDAGDAGLDRSVRSESLYLLQLAFAGSLIAGAIVSLLVRTRRLD